WRCSWQTKRRVATQLRSGGDCLSFELSQKLRTRECTSTQWRSPAVPSTTTSLALKRTVSRRQSCENNQASDRASDHQLRSTSFLKSLSPNRTRWHPSQEEPPSQV